MPTRAVESPCPCASVAQRAWEAGTRKQAPRTRPQLRDLGQEPHPGLSCCPADGALCGGGLLLPTPGVPAVGVPTLPPPPEPVTHVPGHMAARDGLSVAPAPSLQAQSLQTTAEPRGEAGGGRRTGWGAGSKQGKLQGTDSALPGQPNS